MRRARWNDLLAAAVLLVVLGTLGMVAVLVSNETEARVDCASNLRMIAQAMLLFSNDNRGQFPRAIASGDANPVPTWGTPYEGNPHLVGPFDPKQTDPRDARSPVAPKPNDVTAPWFLLLRTQDIGGERFVCPSTGQTAWDYGPAPAGKKNTAMNWSNWAGVKGLRDHLSYSIANPYASKNAIAAGFKWNNSMSAEFPLGADMNSGADALTKLNVNSPKDQMRKGNSPNHNFDGQNVMYADGHVAWESIPFVGVNRDNIYTFGPSGLDHPDKGGDGIVGAPTSKSDAVMLPTAKDLGIVDAAGKFSDEAQKRRDAVVAAMKPSTPDELKAMQQKLIGKYVFAAGRGGGPMLEITAERITVSHRGVINAANYQVTGASGGNMARVEQTLIAPAAGQGASTFTLSPDGKTLDVHGGVARGQWSRQ